MGSVGSLLRDLESSMTRSSTDDRGLIMERLAKLFVVSAEGLSEEQVGIFDVVIGRLSRAIELRARVELAGLLAPIANAPPGVIRQLALDEIDVARPVLTQSPRLSDQDLVAVAAARGQDHMLAISERSEIGESVTDFLILRGGRIVTHSVAGNLSARFSRHGIGVLAMRAVKDQALNDLLADRPDLPAELGEQLVLAAKEAARLRLSATLEPGLANVIDGAVERGAVAERDGSPVAEDVGRFGAASAEMQVLHERGELDEAVVARFASERQAERVVCAVSLLAGLPLSAVEQVVFGPDREAVLMVVRALGWQWDTAEALIGLRTDLGKSSAAIDRARQTFRTIAPATAKRVLGFLKMRGAGR